MLPIIPMVLVNGCEGIATGYSTSIPCYNPKDIIANLIHLLSEPGLSRSETYNLIPYYKGFSGKVIDLSGGSYMTKGTWSKISDTKIVITELPVGSWVTQYKEFLETFIESSKNTTKKKFYLKDVQNMTKDENTGIHFIVEFKNAKDLEMLIKNETLEKELKLVKTFSINNMYLFNPDLILTKYNTALDIIKEYYTIRLTFYEKRRIYIIQKLNEELKVLKSKIRFIEEYIDGTLDINKKSKEYTINLLDKRKYHKIIVSDKSSGEYDYLIHLPVISFTSEKIKELNNAHDKKNSELEYYKSKTDKQLWKIDLENLNKLI
jgi:DNA topoisomerase-2